MSSKNHVIILTVALHAWLFFYLVGLPSNYFIDWRLSEQILLSLITFFGVIPVVGALLLVLLGGDYVKTSLWVAFYTSVPLFLLDYIMVGLVGGEGVHFLVSHWYVSMAYIYVWIELPVIGVALAKIVAGQSMGKYE